MTSEPSIGSFLCIKVVFILKKKDEDPNYRRPHLKSVVRLKELLEVCVFHAPIGLLPEGEDLPDGDSIRPASNGGYLADNNLPNIRLCAELPLRQHLEQIGFIFLS